MKPGLEIGALSEVSFTVTHEMRAAFEGRVVHDVLSTATMVLWMEWAARRLVLPYLEPHEETVGYEIHVRHVAPAPVGARVTCRAILTEIHGREIRTAVEAETPAGRIGEGAFTQMLVSRERFERRITGLDAPAPSAGTQDKG